LIDKTASTQTKNRVSCKWLNEKIMFLAEENGFIFALNTSGLSPAVLVASTLFKSFDGLYLSPIDRNEGY
jgi:hypothetical protein